MPRGRFFGRGEKKVRGSSLAAAESPHERTRASGVPPPRQRTRSLVEICSEIFSLAFSLRVTRDLGDPVEMRRKILKCLDELEGEGRQIGCNAHQIDGARFALVALLDESILSSQWPGKDVWRANPLQKELFKMNVAGEEFYVKLEQLRGKSEENRPLLEVFYACLIMGFEGRYKLLGREKLESLIASLASELSQGHAWSMENLSPAWRPPDDFPEVVGEGVPVWVTILGVLAGAILLILIFSGVGHLEARRVAGHIQEALSGFGR